MSKPRYRRRKEDRPREITEAAYQAFAEKGYAATRVEEVAKRAGVSKGLMYLYFKTKEDLFKAVIRRVVVPRVDSLMTQSAKTDLSAEEFLRGPFTAFLKKLPGSPVSVVVRLMVSEGWRYPELVEFYWDNVISRGLESVMGLVERGIAVGEFSRSPVSEHPQLFIAPAIMAVLWKLVFDAHPLDSDRLIDTQIELLLGQLKSEA